MDLEVKLCSSLVKVMPDRGAETVINSGCALRGERYSFQLVYTSVGNRGRLWVRTTSQLPVRCRKVELVPVRFTGVEIDDDVVGKTPGLYPDLLTELDNYGTEFPLMRGQYRSGWFTVEVPEDCAAGKYEIVLDIEAEDYSGEKCSVQRTFTLEVLNARLEESKLKYTCWLHGDCIATSYGLEIFSEKYWKNILEI